MDELSCRIVALYERHALHWDALRRAGAFPELAWFERLRARLPSGAELLDLGCGAGEPIGRWLMEQGFELTGVDSSATMIALFRSRLPHAGWQCADMRTLSLSRRFHGVIAWDSVFHLTYADQRRMFEVYGAHSHPGALLLFTSGPERGEALGCLAGESLYHASLAEDEYRALLAEHGYHVLSHEARDASCGGRTVWLAQQSGHLKSAPPHLPQ